MFVMLWTDVLVFFLVAMLLLFIGYVQRRARLRQAWRKVGQSHLGMAASVVLFAYLVVGLLDSVHFHPRIDQQTKQQYSTEIISLFDALVYPLRERDEKSYSAPFALHLYTKESVEAADGSQQRVYPRLRYGGAHLAKPADRGRDILASVLFGGLVALLIWLLLSTLLLLWLARRQVHSLRNVCLRVYYGQTELPWKTILASIALILLFICIAAALSSKYHIMGTDKIGADVFYQALKSIRTGLIIGTLTTLVMLPIAVVLGVMAGYFRGWVDDVIQYIYTTLNSIPSVLLIAAAILLLQVHMVNHADQYATLAERADVRLLALCIILGITSWTGLCRMLRGETLKLREMEYVQAAHAFGVSHATILARHILPNLMHIVLISVVLDFSLLVLAEAVLSYLKIGVDPTMHSWGNMINSARLEMAREPLVWWSLTAAFAFMFFLVLSANLFADAVRDAFDPRMK